MRTQTPKNPDATASAQKIHVRPTAKMFKELLAIQKEYFDRSITCSLGDVLLRLAARALNMPEQDAVPVKLPPGPVPRLRRPK